MTATNTDPGTGAERPPERPCSFTASDVEALRRAADAIVMFDQAGNRVAAVRMAATLRDIAARIAREIARATPA
jgi:hypothetical protein